MNGLDIRSLIGLTLRSPMDAAEQIVGFGLPANVRWAFAVLVVALAAILTWVNALLLPPLPEGSVYAYAWIGEQPLLVAGLQLLGLAMVAGLMTGVGRMFGGKGNFEDALILIVWIEAMVLMIQAVKVLILPFAPSISAMLSIAAVGMFFYLVVQFTKALHGFQNGWKVLLAVIGTIFVMGFLMSFIAAGFGLMPEVPA